LASRHCIHCSRMQLVNDIRTRHIRTVFGRITVACRRFIRCTCRGGRPTILWPLGLIELPGNLPYRRAAEMLGELLPISEAVVSHATLRARRWPSVRDSTNA
jgi:hypothetical protein